MEQKVCRIHCLITVQENIFKNSLIPAVWELNNHENFPK